MKIEDWKKKELEKLYVNLFILEEETTGYWMREISDLKLRGIQELFMVSIINNKWLKKVIKMNYPEVIYCPSLIEFYNKTYQYIVSEIIV